MDFHDIRRINSAQGSMGYCVRSIAYWVTHPGTYTDTCHPIAICLRTAPILYLYDKRELICFRYTYTSVTSGIRGKNSSGGWQQGGGWLESGEAVCTLLEALRLSVWAESCSVPCLCRTPTQRSRSATNSDGGGYTSMWPCDTHGRNTSTLLITMFVIPNSMT